jgi:hypothetical protein
MLSRLFPCLALALGSAPAAPVFTVQEVSDGIEIRLDGNLLTKYVTRDAATNKPYFHPLIGPTGAEMTRAYPMRDVPGEKQDHPHHRSMWFGHQFIDASDTWHEEATLRERAKGDDAKFAQLRPSLGATVHRETRRAVAETDRAVLETTSEYQDAAGKLLLRDLRTFVFRVAPDGARLIDVTLAFTGADAPVTLKDAKDAGFSLRVAHAMSVEAGKGGRIVTSTGATDAKAWGQRAPWCDFHGPVTDGGEILGIAVLNHPSSFRFPTPWHARAYGLFTANPFGLNTVAGEDTDGSVVLKPGESITLRYRVILHQGDAETARIAAAYEAYAGEP